MRLKFLAAVGLLCGCAVAGNSQDVSFTQSIGRTPYGHTILGDIPEWHGLRAVLDNGQVVHFTLPHGHIFEDIAPRVVQLDDDRAVEIVVVESHAGLGAALAVYELTDGQIRLQARTHWFGRRNRWLAPVGIADLDDDGRPEIAYVETPHIGGTLRIWRWRDGLVEVASARGHSNHRIGQNFISGGIVSCPQGLAIVTADAQWRTGRLTFLNAEGQLSAESFPIENGTLPHMCP